MKRKLISLILVAATLLALTACGTPNKAVNDSSIKDGSSSIDNSPIIEGSPITDAISPDFQMFVGEWRTLDNDTVTTITLNPDMTMNYNGQTVRLKQISAVEYSMETPLEVVFFNDPLQTDRLNFWLNEYGLYSLSFHFQRDASFGYSQTYFRVQDYQIVDLNMENYTDYVELDFESKCERNPLARPEVYEARSEIELDLNCDYIYDLEISFNCNTIYRPVTFEKGRRPNEGEITKTESSIKTVKAEHPFSGISDAHLRYITLTEAEFSTWPENYVAEDVCFMEPEGIVSISGKAFIAQKLPADDPDHVHFYDSDTCFDDNGNSWQECECGEKSHVTKSDPQ